MHLPRQNGARLHITRDRPLTEGAAQLHFRQCYACTMRRKLTMAALVLLALVAFGLLLVWQAIRGDHVRIAAEGRLSAIFGQPVSITDLGLSVTPLLSVSGSGVRIGETNALAPALDIERIVIRPRLGPLLRRTIVIDDIELRGFVVSVLRDAKGRWRVPSVAPAAGSDPETGATVERVRVVDGRIRVFDERRPGDVQATSSIDAIAATIEPTAKGLRLSPISGQIGGADISGHASTDARAVQLEFTADAIADDDLPALLGLLGAERPEFLKLADPISVVTSVTVDRASAQLTGKGTLRAPQVLLDPVQLRQLESPFSIAADRLHFSPVTFTVARGAHTGAVTMRFDPTRWSIDSRVSGLNVKEFLDRLTGADQRLEGTGSVTAALGGRVDQTLIESATGRLGLVITNGVIRDFPLLAAIDRALKLTAQQGGDTAFERMTGTFDIAAGAARTEDLVITARDVRVHASGRIGGDRSLTMQGIAVLSPDRSARAIASIHEFKGMRNEAGEIEVPLTISGSLDAPTFTVDVASILKKGAIDEIKRRLRRIIR